MHRRDLVSIWFFIGMLLLVYGVVILASAILVTPERQPVLAQYHAGTWWGILLILIGGFYTFTFRPGRR